MDILKMLNRVGVPSPTFHSGEKLKVAIILFVTALLFLAGLCGAVWWKVQSDLYDHGMMDGD